jgi:para-nitrobenzyl esterase
LIVETRYGRVEGQREGGVLCFRGIPFAGPASGAGRWRPPAPPAPWAGVRAAARSGAVAPQTGGLMSRLLGEGELETSEDCLTLDLYTPATDAARRPLLFWIHGGGFTTGAGSLPVYAGAALAERGGVVVVAPNYRLGALGFLCLPELAREEGGAPGNFGLLDQLAALAWVREHAAAFGGDPARVTVFAQSAGAMCAATLMGVARARGLFARAILQSGAARNVHAQATAERVAEVFLAEAGVRRSDLSALRALPAHAVLGAQARTAQRLAREIPDPVFQPALDGALLPRAPLDAVAQGETRGIPLLIGTNRDEWKYYGLGDPRARALDEAGLLRRFRRGLAGADAAGRPWAERALALYRELRPGEAPAELWFAFQTDRWFRHPALRLAERHAAQEPATWLYLFGWRSPALGGALGSCHALEVPFVFGNVAHPRLAALVGEGEAPRRLSERMQDAWCAFARGEAPGRADLPAWPAYEAGRRATFVWDAECDLAFAPGERERAFWDAVD